MQSYMTTMATNQKNLDSLYIDRALNLPELLEKKSLFLLGPRQTGKHKSGFSNRNVVLVLSAGKQKA